MSLKPGIVAVTAAPLLALLTSCAGSGGHETGGGSAGVAERDAAADATASGSRGSVLRTEGFDLAAGTGTALVIDVPSAGTLSATASWGRSGTDIDLYITDSACSGIDDLVLGACSVLARGDSPTSKSETAAATVEAGRYQVFVLAVAERGDAGRVELALE